MKLNYNVPVEEKERLRKMAKKEARAQGVDPDLVVKIVKHESRWDREAVSDKGAKGLMQLMPDTITYIENKLKYKITDPFDPYQNLHGGIMYLKYFIKKYNGDLEKVLAAWNWKPKYVQVKGTLPRLPKVTIKFIEDVLGKKPTQPKETEP